MRGAKRAVQLGCISALQRHSATKAGEPNEHVIRGQALSAAKQGAWPQTLQRGCWPGRAQRAKRRATGVWPGLE